MPKLIGRWNPARGVWETDTMDLLSEHSEPFSATWPSSGTTRSGVAFELPTPALPMVGSASSSSRVLPTPLASDYRSSSPADERRNSPQMRSVLLPTPMTSEARGIGVHGQGAQDLRTTIALLKTPLSNLGENGGSQHPDKRRAGGHGPTLADEVEHLLPTPAAHDSGNTPENHLRKKPGRSVVTSLQVLVDYDLIATGGRIAPPSNAGSESPDD